MGLHHEATMLSTAYTPVRLLATVAGLGLLACGGGDLTLPPDVSPASLDVVSGNGQLGTVGTPLPRPLVVRVTDAAKQPVANVTLRFETQVPEAEIDPPVTATNDTGVAAVQVRLGSTKGVQTIVASLAEAEALKTTFALIAVANDPRDDGDGDDDGDRGKGRGKGKGGDDDD
jgi:hypothetical protein